MYCIYLFLFCFFLISNVDAQEKFSFGIQAGITRNKIIGNASIDLPRGAIIETSGMGFRGFYAHCFLQYETCQWQSFQLESGYTRRAIWGYNDGVKMPVHQWSNYLLSNFHLTSFLSIYGGLETGIRKFGFINGDDFYVNIGVKEKAYITSIVGLNIRFFKVFGLDFRYHFPYKRHNEYFRTADIKPDTVLFSERIRGTHLGLIWYIKK